MVDMMGYPAWLPLLLGFLTAVGPISTDMYLPAFPAMEAALRAAPGSAQITLGTWFAGLAVGQLTQGTLADRFGRRGPLIAGTLLYTVANAGCALAPDLGTLAALRFLAGFGGSASMVIPRAVVRDLADGHAAARLMARLTLVMGAAPILAPTLGALVLAVANWHAIFWITTVYGALCSALVAAALPDTLAPHHRSRLGLVGLLGKYAVVARDRMFLTYALMGGFAMFGMFAYIGGSSPVLIEYFRFTPAQYGVVFGASASFYIVASQISPMLLPRYGAHRLLRVAATSFLLSAVALAVCAVAGLGRAYGLVVPVMAAMACLGFIMPNATVGALSRHAAHAGSASALMGTITFGLAACSGALVGILTDGTARPLALLMLLGASAVVVADRLRPPPSAHARPGRDRELRPAGIG